MKLISEHQQATIRMQFELAIAALISAALVGATVLMTSPLAYSLSQPVVV